MYCYAKSSIVFGPNFRGKSLRGNLPRGGGGGAPLWKKARGHTEYIYCTQCVTLLKFDMLYENVNYGVHLLFQKLRTH